MSGIVISINPIVIELGTFQLRWYSIAILLAVVAAIVITAYEGKRKGVSPDVIYSLAPWVVIGGAIGARLFHIFDQWGYYSAHPLEIAQFQQGGLAIWGAMAGGGLAVVIYSIARHLSLRKLADILVPGLLVAQIIGRLGCIVNGDAYGGPTSLPWGFIYIHPNALIPAHLFGIPTHPYPVYEMLWNGLTLAVLLKVRHRFTADGMLFLSYLVFYSVGRFLLTYVRQENAFFWGLQQAQFISLAILALSIVALLYMNRKRTAPEGTMSR